MEEAEAVLPSRIGVARPLRAVGSRACVDGGGSACEGPADEDEDEEEEEEGNGWSLDTPFFLAPLSSSSFPSNFCLFSAGSADADETVEEEEEGGGGGGNSAGEGSPRAETVFFGGAEFPVGTTWRGLVEGSA